MSDILERIVAAKRLEIDRQRAATSLAQLEAQLGQAPAVRNFRAALEHGPRMGIIAEVKKASPSAGVLRNDFDPVAIAHIYEANGADAVSVLTDEPFFQGRLSYLSAIRQAVRAPVLRKDFLLDPYQVVQARAFGADAVLLIAEILSDQELPALLRQVHELGMQALVELYEKDHLPRVLESGATIIGVNNRNLRTFETSLDHTLDLAAKVPTDCCLVSESGIRTPHDMKRLHEAGVKAVLVGETLMRAPDIGQKLASLALDGASDGEIRNTKQYQNTKDRNRFFVFRISYCFGFRVSHFGFVEVIGYVLCCSLEVGMLIQCNQRLFQSVACALLAWLVLSWVMPANPQTVTNLQPAWDNLASFDATRAYRAIWTMMKSPDQSIAFIRSRLKPVADPDPQTLVQLIGDLTSDTFTTRDKAVRELEHLAELAEVPLKKANVKGLTLEVKRRIEKLLARLEEPVASPDQLRQFRALEVLELLGTDAAHKLVKELAEGSPHARLTKHAKATLERLVSRPRCAATVTQRQKRDWYDDPLPEGAAVRLGTTRFRDARHIAFLPDGKTMIVSRYGTLHHYDAVHGKETAGFPIKDSEVCWDNAAISPDGRFMAASSGFKVGLRELPSGKPLHTFSIADDSGCFYANHMVTISSDGSVISAANNWTAYSWDLKTRKLIKQFKHSDHRDGRTVYAVFSANGKYLAIGNGEKAVPVWDVATGKLLYRLDGHEQGIWRAAFSLDGATLATGGYVDKTIRLWDVATGKLRQELAIGKQHVTSVAFAPNGKQLAAVGRNIWSDDNGREIYCWDLASSPTKSRIFNSPTVSHVRYAPDGQALVCCHDWVAVGFLDPTSGKELRPLEAHRSGIGLVAFSADGAMAATGSDDETIRVWDTATGKHLKKLTGMPGTVGALAFSADGKELRSIADGVAVLWDITTGAKKKIVHHGKPGWYVAFSPDWRYLAATEKVGPK